VNWSLASYEDVGEFFQNSLFKDSASPGNSLKDIMSTDLTFTTPEAKIDDLKQLFSKVQSWSDLSEVIRQQGRAFLTPGRLPLLLQVTGVPVVKSDTDMTLVGVLSKKDLGKKGKLVKDIYSSPPVAARPENKVADAACLMLKHKVSASRRTNHLPCVKHAPHNYAAGVLHPASCTSEGLAVHISMAHSTYRPMEHLL
jgi:CBS domain-containing protein